MIMKKVKIGALGVLFAAAATSFSASAQQLPVIGGLPLAGDVLGGDLLGGGIPVVGGLLGGDLLGGGIPVVGGLLGGGIPGVGGLAGDNLLGGGLPLSAMGLGGNALPFGIDGAAVSDEILGVVLGIGTDALSGGGIAAIPLVGEDISFFATPEGLYEGVQGILTNLRLPVGLPVAGRNAVQLLVPVGATVLNTYGLPVGEGDIPQLGLGEVSNVLLLPLSGLEVLAL